MKTKMILIIGLAVFTAMISNVQRENTSSVSDQELDDVVGGLDCHYCGSNGDGCADSISEGSCTLPDCDGYQVTSCKQSQQHCKSATTIQTCTNSLASCAGEKYIIRNCTKEQVFDPGQGKMVDTCVWSDSQEYDCSGWKTTC